MMMDDLTRTRTRGLHTVKAVRGLICSLRARHAPTGAGQGDASVKALLLQQGKGGAKREMRVV